MVKIKHFSKSLERSMLLSALDVDIGHGAAFSSLPQTVQFDASLLTDLA